MADSIPSTDADDVQPRRRRVLTAWMVAVGVFSIAVSTVFVLAGPTLLATFNLTYDRMGVLLSAVSFGAGAASLAAGVLLDVVAVASLARGSLLIAAAACIAGGLAPTWGLLGASMLILGAATGALSLLLFVFFADFYPRDRTRVMARWQIPGSLAAVIFPLLVGLLLARAADRFGDERGWRVLLFGCAPVFLVLLALMPARSLGRRSSVDSPRLRDLVEVLRRPMFLSVLIIGLLHTSADNATYLWLIMMLKQRFGVGPVALGLVAAAYSLAYTCGRLVRGTVRWPLAPLPTIASGSLVGATILAVAVRAPTLSATIALYAAAGLFFSLNYPSILGYAADRFPDRAGTVLGAVSSVSAPGTAAASAVVGLVSRFGGGITVGLLVPVGIFFALGVFAAATHLRARRRL